MADYCERTFSINDQWRGEAGRLLSISESRFNATKCCGPASSYPHWSKRIATPTNGSVVILVVNVATTMQTVKVSFHDLARAAGVTLDFLPHFLQGKQLLSQTGGRVRQLLSQKIRRRSLLALMCGVGLRPTLPGFDWSGNHQLNIPLEAEAPVA